MLGEIPLIGGILKKFAPNLKITVKTIMTFILAFTVDILYKAIEGDEKQFPIPKNNDKNLNIVITNTSTGSDENTCSSEKFKKAEEKARAFVIAFIACNIINAALKILDDVVKYKAMKEASSGASGGTASGTSRARSMLLPSLHLVIAGTSFGMTFPGHIPKYWADNSSLGHLSGGLSTSIYNLFLPLLKFLKTLLAGNTQNEWVNNFIVPVLNFVGWLAGFIIALVSFSQSTSSNADYETGFNCEYRQIAAFVASLAGLFSGILKLVSSFNKENVDLELGLTAVDALLIVAGVALQCGFFLVDF